MTETRSGYSRGLRPGRHPTRQLRVAVIGAGYWGPNLVRNFRPARDWDARRICDLDLERAARRRPPTRLAVTDVVDELLDRDDVDAVAIATPARTHHAIALAALEAGQARAGREAARRQRGRAAGRWSRAAERGLVLMSDHTYCYTPAVLKIRELSRTAPSATSCSSTRCGSTSGSSSRTSTCSGTSPRTTCRSSTSSCPAVCGRGVAAHGRRPARHRARPASGYLTLPLAGRRHRPRPRQLAEPDEDPADGHRRLPSAPSSGTT